MSDASLVLNAMLTSILVYSVGIRLVIAWAGEPQDIRDPSHFPTLSFPNKVVHVIYHHLQMVREMPILMPLFISLIIGVNVWLSLKIS